MRPVEAAVSVQNHLESSKCEFRKKLDNNIHFLGYRTDVPKLLKISKKNCNKFYFFCKKIINILLFAFARYLTDCFCGVISFLKMTSTA